MYGLVRVRCDNTRTGRYVASPGENNGEDAWKDHFACRPGEAITLAARNTGVGIIVFYKYHSFGISLILLYFIPDES